MKYAIVADVHANLEALIAVLAAIEHDGVDSIVCLGDLVGYNANPNACVDLVKARGMRSIAGNHDRAAVGAKDTSRFGPAARRALEWTRAALTEESREYLAGLPSTLLIDGRFFVVHGALHPEPNDDLHLTNDVRVARSFEELVSGRFGSKICFFGHTHRPVIYERRAGALRRMEDAHAILSPDAHYLVNPGSVGQSRDGDPRAAYALFDADGGGVELRRVPYDRASTEHGARAAGLLSSESLPARSAHWLRARLDQGRDLVLDRVKTLPAFSSLARRLSRTPLDRPRE